MEEYYEAAFQIISNVGMAKSLAVEAMYAAKEKKFDLAKQKLAESNKFFVKGHKYHNDFVKKEANGEKLVYTMIFMHAEDQLMSVETITILAKEIIDLHKTKS
ncbi:PTS lactose/cellobiose transporter subunit IIA [Pediococcus acidilactici]|nr:PTS lactose/cellobiose transporter subunit IIA [Pediococcus acidilactici]UWF34381.1 PTS lactose/cellobiose transporter subunit IIA [Pediococcus acidilactici]